jgi:large subunit ribosomal protein L22
MEVRAVGRYIRVQPRKVRIIADEVRGKNAAQAAQILRFHPSKSARFLRKILISAMANAQENANADISTLKIVRIQVDEGPRLKRIQARAQGRANRIIKKTSHITVVVEEAEGERIVKAHGTKAKPRPTLEAAPKKGKKAPVEAAPVVEEAPVEATAEETVETPVEATAEAAPTEEVAAEGETGASAETPASEAPEEATEAPAEAADTNSEEEKGAN